MTAGTSNETARVRLKARGIEGILRIASLAVDADGRDEVDVILWRMAADLHAIKKRARQRTELRSGEARHGGVAVRTRVDRVSHLD